MKFPRNYTFFPSEFITHGGLWKCCVKRQCFTSLITYGFGHPVASEILCGGDDIWGWGGVSSKEDNYFLSGKEHNV